MFLYVTLRSCDDCARPAGAAARGTRPPARARRRPAPTAHSRLVHRAQPGTSTCLVCDRNTVHSPQSARLARTRRLPRPDAYFVLRSTRYTQGWAGADRVSRSLTFVADVRDAHSGPLIEAATDRARRARGMLATRASSGSATRTHICSPPPCTRAARAMRRS